MTGLEFFLYLLITITLYTGALVHGLRHRSWMKGWGVLVVGMLVVFIIDAGSSLRNADLKVLIAFQLLPVGFGLVRWVAHRDTLRAFGEYGLMTIAWVFLFLLVEAMVPPTGATLFRRWG